MKVESIKSYLEVSKAIQEDVDKLWLPPAIGLPSHKEMILFSSLVKGTRGYIEVVVNQINITYEYAAYDACAVMIRRLVETLIIEVFEKHGIASKIKNSNGDFPYLKDLIGHALSETSWNLTRNAKQALPKLKNVGDLSAHSRRYNAHRKDIDNIIDDLRVSVQELLYLAGLK